MPIDSLETKATEVVALRQNRKADKELVKYIEDTYDIRDKREIAFLLEFIKTGKSYKSYQKVYGEHITNGGAAVSANKILKKAKFRISDFLDNSGHSVASMMEVLETLRSTDPKEYLKYTIKLHGLDVTKTEVTGSLKIEYEKDFDA